MNHVMSESTMEALDAIDDAIDALDGLSPTPPKKQCSREDVVSVKGRLQENGMSCASKKGYHNDY